MIQTLNKSTKIDLGNIFQILKKIVKVKMKIKNNMSER